MLIEIIENVAQISVLFICAGIALHNALAEQSRIWTLTFFFLGSFGLGDIYWLVCLIFYGESPQISVVSNLSWYAAYIFLYMMLRRAAPPEGSGRRHLLPWAGPAFSAVMAVYFMQWGDILNNLLIALLMGLLSFSALARLSSGSRYRNQRFLFVSALFLYVTEYALWISSCLWEYTPSSPYYWFDILLTLSFIPFVPAVRKAVAE